MLKQISLLSVIILLSLNSISYATCENKGLDPIGDVCWGCAFPMKVAGVTIKGSPIETPEERIKNKFCLCGKTFGTPVSFWEPARIAETVKDAYCFPSIGANLNSSDPGFLSGSSTEKSTNKEREFTFAQAHWYIFSVWNLLDLFMDFPCINAEEFDVAYITEVDPMWNDDILAAIINPEALLFANPIAQMACAVDSLAVSTAEGTFSSDVTDALFWCLGSWGGAYPLTGHFYSSNEVQANAGIASRMIYKLGREGLLWDTGLNVCGAVWTPIWYKSNYRMHISKPVRDKTCHPIGKTSLLWGQLKNPPYKAGGNASDNYMWMMIRKKLCCVGYTL